MRWTGTTRPRPVDSEFVAVLVIEVESEATSLELGGHVIDPVLVVLVVASHGCCLWEGSSRSSFPDACAGKCDAAHVSWLVLKPLDDGNHFLVLEEAYVVVGWWWRRKNRFRTVIATNLRHSMRTRAVYIPSTTQLQPLTMNL